MTDMQNLQFIIRLYTAFVKSGKVDFSKLTNLSSLRNSNESMRENLIKNRSAWSAFSYYGREVRTEE